MDACYVNAVDDADADAHVTNSEVLRHEREIMFNADQNAGTTRWHVVRLSLGSTVSCTLLSPSFFALTTHWTGQTVPCSGEDCGLCEFSPGRGMFYVAVYWNSRVCLLELSSVSASHFEQHCRLLHGGMRAGLEFVASRRTEKRPIYTEATGFKEGTKAIEHLDLAAHVMLLYKLPCPNPGETIETYEERIRLMTKIRNRRLADQAKKGQVRMT